MHIVTRGGVGKGSESVHTRVQSRQCSKRDTFTHTIAQVGDYLLEYREDGGPEISEVPNLHKKAQAAQAG